MLSWPLIETKDTVMDFLLAQYKPIRDEFSFQSLASNGSGKSCCEVRAAHKSEIKFSYCPDLVSVNKQSNLKQ